MRAALAVLLLAAAAAGARAEEGIRPIGQGLSPRAAELLRQRVDARMAWIYDLAAQVGYGYQMPDRRPEIFLVSRAWIEAHAKDICFRATTPEELRACSTHVFGWIDDDRRVYALRGEDVQATAGFPSMPDFPVDIWVEMEWTHELTHYLQLERSGKVPSRLSCADEARMEQQAFTVAAQWLHSLRSIDAERINTAFRGGFPVFSCRD